MGILRFWRGAPDWLLMWNYGATQVAGTLGIANNMVVPQGCW